MKDFITRDQANDPKKIDLDDGHYLEVVSAHSDEFKTNQRKIITSAALLASTSEFTAEIQIKKEAELIAACVVGWKLPKEYGKFSYDNAVKLLFNHPQLKEQVDVFITDDANYLAKK